MLLTLCFVKLLLFWIQVWPCQKDSRINSRYFKFGGNIRCFASKALEFLRALVLRSVTQHSVTLNCLARMSASWPSVRRLQILRHEIDSGLEPIAFDVYADRVAVDSKSARSLRSRPSFLFNELQPVTRQSGIPRNFKGCGLRTSQTTNATQRVWRLSVA